MLVRVGYDPVIPAQTGIQKDSGPPLLSKRLLAPCLRRDDIVTSGLKTVFRAMCAGKPALATFMGRMTMPRSRASLS